MNLFILLHASRSLHIRPLNRAQILSITDDSSLQVANKSETVSQKFPLDFCCKASPTPAIYPKTESRKFPVGFAWAASRITAIQPEKCTRASKKRKSNGKSISPTQLKRSKLVVLQALNGQIAKTAEQTIESLCKSALGRSSGRR